MTKMREIQLRMNRMHGTGLKNLRASLTHETPAPAVDPAVDRNSQAPGGANEADSYIVNSYTIYPHEWQSFPLGVVSGLQYDNNTFGGCFYAVADTLQFIQYFKQDWINFITTFAYYPLFVYDPTRLLSNYLALYE